MDRYSGKKVVIIGGTSGMGLTTAKTLLDGGARVLVTGRSQAGIAAAQKELGTGGVAVSSDAQSLTAIDALSSRVKAEFDTFDLLPKWDYCALAKAFGAKGYRVKTIGELQAVLQELKKPTSQPSLVEVVIPEKDLPDQMRRLGLE